MAAALAALRTEPSAELPAQVQLEVRFEMQHGAPDAALRRDARRRLFELQLLPQQMSLPPDAMAAPPRWLQVAPLRQLRDWLLRRFSPLRPRPSQPFLKHLLSLDASRSLSRPLCRPAAPIPVSEGRR